MPLRAGQLDQRVTFQRLTRTADTQGGGAVVWAAISGLSNVAAMITWDSGDEMPRSDQLVAQRRGVVRTRYSALMDGVTAKDRIVWNSRTLEIVGSPMPGGMRLREWFDFPVVDRTS